MPLTPEEREWMEYHERRVLEDDAREAESLLESVLSVVVRPANPGWTVRLPSQSDPPIDGEERGDGSWWFLTRERAVGALCDAARVRVPADERTTE